MNEYKGKSMRQFDIEEMHDLQGSSMKLDRGWAIFWILLFIGVLFLFGTMAIDNEKIRSEQEFRDQYPELVP